WITIRRDDDKLYKFKEGDFKRLRIQDNEDMLLLLVQSKLTNLTVDECLAFNVSLLMFTRSTVIQRHVEDISQKLPKKDQSYKAGYNYDQIPKRPTMYLNLWSYKAVRHRYSNPMIHPEPEGSTQGYPLVSVEVLRILKDGGEGTCFQLSQKCIVACSYPTNNYKDITKAQVNVSRLLLL
nr:hypothetical protein [Tanacetum cinerariifolium]